MKIILADDHAVVREGFVPFLETLSPAVTVLEAADFAQAEDLARTTPSLALVILDLYMPGMNGMDGVKSIRELLPQVPLAILSGSMRHDDARHALACGAAAYLPKTMRGKALISALRLVLDGERYIPAFLADPHDVAADQPAPAREPDQFMALTSRERMILAAVIDGKTNKLIARDLGIQEVTIKAHIRNIFRKLGVANRTEAAKVVYQAGGLALDAAEAPDGQSL